MIFQKVLPGSPQESIPDIFSQFVILFITGIRPDVLQGFHSELFLEIILRVSLRVSSSNFLRHFPVVPPEIFTEFCEFILIFFLDQLPGFLEEFLMRLNKPLSGIASSEFPGNFLRVHRVVYRYGLSTDHF